MANPKLTDEELARLVALRQKTQGRYKKQTIAKNKRYDIVTLAVPKGVKGIWRSEADNEGKSLTQFVADAVDFYIDNKS